MDGQIAAVKDPGADIVDAPAFDKQSWLDGATDLEEGTIYIEEIGDSVEVVGLTAGQLASIGTQCTTMKGANMKYDAVRADVMKFSAGVVKPKFSEDEANVIAHRFGKAFSLVVSVIDEISRATEEDIAKAKARFHARPKR